ncbi:helix-turn-helix transcriptional regulator [Agrobacterium vaccinii]|uniref:helix-turn-helix transcriptional regulator n=1 Tax=Agrobacterium vaccinii TaxID=2735528 RepID=UPI001E387467|nr:helix-turn-helix transcriptional regulator [Agrobacterium vaccinii]UHS56305.1 helix-turn-helix domain-containing protein [Agrobacterium vaccinii]
MSTQSIFRVEKMIAPPNVLRAARELVGMKQVDAAEAAGISRRSLQRLETGERGWANAAVLLQTYYENQGVVFIRPANGNGWGLIDNSRGSDISSGKNGTDDLD